MFEIPTPTSGEIETVLVGMMSGTSDFSRWVKLDDAHLQFSEEERLGDTMWWADVIGPDGVGRGCCGGGTTPVEAAAAAWVEACLGAWWCDHSDQSPEEFLNNPRRVRNLTEEEYLSVPRHVPDVIALSSMQYPPLSRGRKRSNEQAVSSAHPR